MLPVFIIVEENLEYKALATKATVKKLYNYTGRLSRTVDGDTIRVLVEVGFSIFTEIIFRLARVDTPELKSKDLNMKAKAIEAKLWLEDLLSGEQLFIDSKSRDRYGRFIAEIYMKVGNDYKNVSDMIIARHVLS